MILFPSRRDVVGHRLPSSLARTIIITPTHSARYIRLRAAAEEENPGGGGGGGGEGEGGGGASGSSPSPPPSPTSTPTDTPQTRRVTPARQPPANKAIMRPEEATDLFAANLTRRFGLKGGLAWLGLLTFGVLSEQIKTRYEAATALKETQAVSSDEAVSLPLPSGQGTYTDLVRGGGAPVRPGMLLLVNFKGTVLSTGQVSDESSESTTRHKTRLSEPSPSYPYPHSPFLILYLPYHPPRSLRTRSRGRSPLCSRTGRRQPGSGSASGPRRPWDR